LDWVFVWRVTVNSEVEEVRNVAVYRRVDVDFGLAVLARESDQLDVIFGFVVDTSNEAPVV
jgi:hypothetical protein